jgi:hypothetical protein
MRAYGVEVVQKYDSLNASDAAANIQKGMWDINMDYTSRRSVIYQPNARNIIFPKESGITAEKTL